MPSRYFRQPQTSIFIPSCYTEPMPASKPNVVFQQVQRNDLAKVRANFAQASPEERSAYLAYREGTGLKPSMLEKAVDNGNPKMVCLLLEQGAGLLSTENSRRLWNNWANRVREIRTKPPSETTRKDLDTSDAILDALVEHGLGKSDLVGVCWGPAHIVVSAHQSDPPRALDRLNLLEQAGYGLDDVDEVGETPLMIACWDLTPAVAEWLLARQPNLSAQTLGGNTPLSFVFRSAANSEDKNERLPQVMACLSALHSAGYDFNVDTESKQRMAADWPEPTSFKQMWNFVVSLREQDRLEASTAPVAMRRPGGPRL